MQQFSYLYAMEVKFIKDHLDHKAGEVVNLEDSKANYLIRVGAAELVTVEVKHKRTTKKK